MASLRSTLSGFFAANRRACRRLEARFPGFFGYPSYLEELEARIARDLEAGCTTVLEAGGTDRPFLTRGHGYRYNGLDIEDKPTCHEVYDEFWVQSIEQTVPVQHDMIVSTTLLEHVPDNTASTRSMFEGLAPGGTTHHYVPSRGHPYALIARLVGPALQKRLIVTLRDSAYHSTTGYPTFFDECSVGAMRRAFRRAGFVDIDVRCFYRANDYFSFFVPAFVLLTAFENLCRTLRWRYFASGFVISGRRPA